MRIESKIKYVMESRVKDIKRFTIWKTFGEFDSHKEAISNLEVYRKTLDTTDLKFRIKEIVHTELILPI